MCVCVCVCARWMPEGLDDGWYGLLCNKQLHCLFLHLCLEHQLLYHSPHIIICGLVHWAAGCVVTMQRAIALRVSSTVRENPTL